MSRVESQVPVERLREFLRGDAPAREQSAARFMAGMALSLLPVVLLLEPLVGWGLSGLLVAVIGPFALYQLGMLQLIKRGHYAEWISWLNMFLETSIPLAVILADFAAQGAVYALTAPPIMFWGAMIMFSVLRVSPRLCVAAGALAAIEYLFFYFAIAQPQLPPGAIATLQPPIAFVRAFLLISTGVGCAIVARQLLNKAQQALSAVRAQDLMSKYFVHEQLGEGGMAEVFRATYCPEGGFEKIVAIKRVLPSYSNDPHFIELFRREAQLCSRLNHPNIVQVTDMGRFDGQYVLAMEFVEGLPLNALLKRRGGPLPVAAVTYVGSELASALDYLHTRTDASGQALGLVHRDVNPPNVLISRIGEVKLSDFGVAHAATRPETSAGIVGKPNYLSPEQARREPIDGRADLFCLGLTMYEALTGVRVLVGSTREETITSVFLPVKPPSSYRQDIPAELETLVLDLLSQDRARRPATGREIRARLMALEGIAAPYPLGHEQLAQTLVEALEAKAFSSSPPKSAPALEGTLTVPRTAATRAEG